MRRIISKYNMHNNSVTVDFQWVANLRSSVRFNTIFPVINSALVVSVYPRTAGHVLRSLIPGAGL